MMNLNQYTLQNNGVSSYAAPQQLIFNPVPVAVPVVNTTAFQEIPSIAQTSNLAQTSDYQILTVLPQGLEYFSFEDGALVNKVAESTINGLVYPPEGYSFVSTTDLNSFMQQLQTAYNETQKQASPSPPPVEQKTQLPLVKKDTNIVAEQKPAAKQPQQPQKRPHRSKQIRITEVHTRVSEIYEAKHLIASDDEVLRGPDTLRVHVKTWEGLQTIEEVLQEVEDKVKRLALPFSMKNKFQKKGFIVYMKLKDVSQVPYVQSVFGRYPDNYFKKCDVALPSQKSMEMAAQKASLALRQFQPPVFAKHASAGAA
jgi:hypothetical protein